MAISIDYGNTNVISVPLADLTLISPGEYSIDTDAFRLELKQLEATEEGIVFPDTHIHNTEVSFGGLTLARVLQIINGYTITFEDGQYSVALLGSNNNFADEANVNQVSIRSQNSAGLQVVSSGSGLSAGQDALLSQLAAQVTELRIRHGLDPTNGWNIDMGKPNAQGYSDDNSIETDISGNGVTEFHERRQ